VDGGVAASSWRAGAVALGSLSCLYVLWTPVPRRGVVALVIVPLIAFAGLSLASAWWSAAPSASLLASQRILLYIAAMLSFVLARDGLVAGVAVGAGSVAAWALGTRFVEGTSIDRFEGRLLTGPIGYANGLGALTAVGIAVCIALALRPRRPLVLVSLVFLVPALSLTNSRGAVLALVAGVAVAVAVAAGRRALAGAVVCGSAILLVCLLVFTPAAVGDRAAYWSAARATAEAHPLGGSGAGTFGVIHVQAPYARDAHSLYLQTLSELGVPGLVLLVWFLTLPLFLAIRNGLCAPAAGLVVFVLHAGVDLDWQLPAVTLAGLALAGAAVMPPATGCGPARIPACSPRRNV
jgi:O-antigen ligase